MPARTQSPVGDLATPRVSPRAGDSWALSFLDRVRSLPFRGTRAEAPVCQELRASISWTWGSPIPGPYRPLSTSCPSQRPLVSTCCGKGPGSASPLLTCPHEIQTLSRITNQRFYLQECLSLIRLCKNATSLKITWVFPLLKFKSLY